MARYKEFRPQQGAQELFLSSSADWVFYGGAAGGGKTMAILMECLRHISNPEYRALIIRQTYKQIMQPGSIWDESAKIYPYFGGMMNKSNYSWTFPSGATISFGYLDLDKDKLNYLGSQITLIAFDQVEQIKEDNFFYMMSRNRSTSGIKPYVRANCNPDADSWLASFLSWWIDQETGYPIPERAGVIRWLIRLNGEIIWSDSKEELIEKYRTDDEVIPKSVTFIPAKLTDNPILMRIDPSYIANLKALSLVDQERLLGGNWKIRPSAGNVFKRSWFEVVEAAPMDVAMRVRYWDFAATKDGGDYTVGVMMSRAKDNVFYIEDVVRGQWGAGEVENVVLQTAQLDARIYSNSIQIFFEQEGGSSGKEHATAIIKKLNRYTVRPHTVTGNKIVRANPLSAQAYAGNVRLVNGKWVKAFLDELESFPESLHDDQVDAASGAFNRLVANRGWTW